MDKITDAFVILVCTVGGWYKSEMGKGGKRLTLTKIRDSCVIFFFLKETIS